MTFDEGVEKAKWVVPEKLLALHVDEEFLPAAYGFLGFLMAVRGRDIPGKFDEVPELLETLKEAANA